MVDQTLDFLKANPGQAVLRQPLARRHAHAVGAVRRGPDDRQEGRRGRARGTRESGSRRCWPRWTGRSAGCSTGFGPRSRDGRRWCSSSATTGRCRRSARRRTAGLRGSKLSLYEGGIRVPFIAWWPGIVKAGVANDDTVLAARRSLPDALQAVRRAACRRATSPDGEDLGAALRGRGARSGRSRCSGSTAATTRRSPTRRTAATAARTWRCATANWKLLVNADGTGAELYDLAADPKETKDVAAANPDVTKRLTDMALAWRKSLP